MRHSGKMAFVVRDTYIQIPTLGFKWPLKNYLISLNFLIYLSTIMIPPSEYSTQHEGQYR